MPREGRERDFRRVLYGMAMMLAPKMSTSQIEVKVNLSEGEDRLEAGKDCKTANKAKDV